MKPQQLTARQQLQKIYYRLALSVVIAALFFIFHPAVTQAADKFVAGQVVIKINPLSGATIAQINATYGTITLKTLSGLTQAYLLKVPAGTTVENLVARMATDLRLLFAEPNFNTQAPESIGTSKWAWGGPSPAPITSQYAITLVNLPAAQTISRGAGIIVAVLDTGIQLNHPQLRNNLTTARYDFVDNDTNPSEQFDLNGDGRADRMAGHGTHVAGIIRLVAPDAKIMPLRVLDADGVGDQWRIAEAIQYAVANGAKVINLSLGTADKTLLLEEVIYVANRSNNVLTVAAAGNGNTSAKQYPAGFTSKLLSVTAIGSTRQRATFANYGSWVDVAAPGVSIYSAFPLNGYAYWSGTSMAAPFVSGQAALIRSRFPTLKAQKVEERILKSARPLADGLGAGLIDMAASLQGVSAAGLEEEHSDNESGADESEEESSKENEDEAQDSDDTPAPPSDPSAETLPADSLEPAIITAVDEEIVNLHQLFLPVIITN